MSLFIQETNNCFYKNPSYQTLSLNEETPDIIFLPKLNDLSEKKDDFLSTLLSILKNEENLTLKDKLDFSYLVSIAVSSFTEEMIKEFNEEESHLSLLNWVWRYKKKFKEFRIENELKNSIKLIPNFDYFFSNKYNKLLIEINFILQLLINILNIFKFLPITSSELLNLKFYEKLSKIKDLIKSFAQQEILNTLDIVLLKWKIQIDSENEQKIITKFKLDKLGIKRKREEKNEEQDTEADSANDDSGINLINNINNIYNIKNYGNININKKKKNKKIKVSFDFSQNSVIEYQKDDSPFQITLDKEKNKSFKN